MIVMTLCMSIVLNVIQNSNRLWQICCGLEVISLRYYCFSDASFLFSFLAYAFGDHSAIHSIEIERLSLFGTHLFHLRLYLSQNSL